MNWTDHILPSESGGSHLCTVYICDRDGARFATNVSAASSHEAARKAIEFFADDFWKGPKPTGDTILEICPQTGPRIRVRVGAVTSSGA